MEKVIDGIDDAYQELVAAITNVLETKAVAIGDRTATTDAALDNFHKKWEAFKRACDEAEEFVDSLKQSLTANTTYPVNEDMIDIFDHAAVVDYDLDLDEDD